MSNQKKRKKKNTTPAPDRYAGMSKSRRKLHERADEISAQFASVDKYLNRILLAIFAVVVVLWIVKVIPGQSARYAIVAIWGATLGLNGLAGYRNSKWAGFFLMVFGSILMISNLVMLTTQ